MFAKHLENSIHHKIHTGQGKVQGKQSKIRILQEIHNTISADETQQLF